MDKYTSIDVIAKATGLDQSKVSASIKTLEEMGLVVVKTEVYQEISLKD